jgi:hypothetical protein
LAIRPLAFVRRSRAAALADPASADSLRTYPTRKVRWNWPVQTYIGLVSNIAHLTGDQRKELRRMNRELEELLDATSRRSSNPTSLVKRAKLSL